MTCPQCGFLNPPGFRFCGQCGAPQRPAQVSAERRQLSVLFFDLVGSTTLSSEQDPEVLSELIHAYHEACARVLRRFEGHVAQYLGDGLLVYFGYPVAHEDDGLRAVQSSLAILEAMRDLNVTLKQRYGVALDIRCGIHTGLVVVGEVGAGGHVENLALGETPNVAARLQGVAGINEVVISGSTAQLVEGHARLADLGGQVLKGVPEPVPAYRVDSLVSGQESRREQRRVSRPLVGRQRELERLRAEWSEVRAGRGRTLQLLSEAGMGKSRLAQAFKEEVRAQGGQVASFYCQGALRHTPLYPVRDWLARELHQTGLGVGNLSDLSDYLRRHSRLDVSQSLPFFAHLLGWECPLENDLSPARLRQMTLYLTSELCHHKSQISPLLLTVDGHDWLDPSTTALVQLLSEKGAPIFLLLLGRAEHPGPGQVVRLAPLGDDESAALLAQAGATGDRQALLKRAQGVPLFLEELARASQEGSLKAESIPPRLQDFLMSRLDSLGEAKSLLQSAATMGEIFPGLLLEALEPGCQSNVARLVDEGVLLREEGMEDVLRFHNPLMREAAYGSQLLARRRALHGRIARLLVDRFPHWARQRPEMVAAHFDQAGEAGQALPFWQQAIQRSLAQSAHEEALELAKQALKSAGGLGGPAALAAEVGIQLARGSAWIARAGYGAPEVGQSFERARELCAALGDGAPLFPALAGLWAYHLVAGHLARTAALADLLAGLASDDSLRLVARAAQGQTAFFQGRLPDALEHFREVARLHQPEAQRGLGLAFFLTDPAVACASYRSWTHYFLGEEQEARRSADQAMAMAEALGHAHTMAHTLLFEAWLLLSTGQATECEALCDRLLALSEEQLFPLWMFLGQTMQGAARLALGRIPDGVAGITEGLNRSQQTGAQLGRSWFQALVAELQSPEPALVLLLEAQRQAEEQGEHWYLPELYRLEGDKREAMGQSGQDCYRKAIEEARRCANRELEERALFSLRSAQGSSGP